MRAGRLGKRLVVAVPTAVVTVATGVAVNAAFITGHGLIWPWVSAAVGLALVQILMLGPEPDPPATGDPGAELELAGQRTRGEQERRAAIAAYLRDAAAENVCIPEMPIAWKAVLKARAPDPKTMRVTGAEEIAECLLRSQERRMVIVGEAGSGKTSLAWRMVRDLAARDGLGGLFPVVVPVGSWNPFEESFDDWLGSCLPEIAGPPAAGLNTAEVLPILDGLDEYSGQLRNQAMGVLSNRHYSGRPLVVLSRPDPYIPAAAWCEIVAGAVMVELMPLPAREIVRYIEDHPRIGSDPARDSVVAEIKSRPAGVPGTALALPFMLDTFTRTQAFSPDFLWQPQYRDISEIEELLAVRFIERQVRQGLRWGSGNPQKWLSAIAAQAHDKFTFRPNELEIPVPVYMCVFTAAAVLPVAAMLTDIRRLPLLLGLVLAGGSWLGLLITGLYTGNGPTIDPRYELRIEREGAIGKAAAAAGITGLLGILDVTAPYIGEWTLALGSALAALLLASDRNPARWRLTMGLAGASCGPVLGWAAYAGPGFGPSWRFVVPAITTAALLFAAVLIINLASHISDGQGREGIFVAPLVAAFYAFTIGLLAGCVSAVAALSQLGFITPLISRIAGLIFFAAATAGAILLTTKWIRIWAGYAYYALRGTFPLRLLAFLEDFSELRVLRRVGYAYEFKHPAILRAAVSAKTTRENR